MITNRLAFLRADASKALGGGHIFRCLTLADALAESGWRCTFVCKPETREVVPALGRSRHEIIDLHGPDESCFLRALRTTDADLLVVDHYGLDTGLEAACRPWVRRILVIDDGPNRAHDCDILLDQNLGANPSAYHGHVPGRCHLLLGPSFALLRPQFSTARDGALKRHLTKRPVQRLLISLGAADPARLASRVVAATAGLPLEIDVVLDSTGTQEQAIRELASRLGLSVRVHVDVTDMAALMSAADLAVGAGGSTSWERCCLGLPSLIVVLADNQRDIAASLDRAGAALDLGTAETLTNEKLTAALQMLYQDKTRRSAMAERAAAICDGDGTRRVMEVLANG